MPVNEMFLKEQFVTAKKYHEKLRELIKFEFHEFESDFNLRLIGERIFEILTQTMLDICTHIVAHSDQSPPNSYFECMKILAKLGVLDEKETEKYSSMIKMRNTIVHRYGVIDYETLFESMKKLEQDYMAFQDLVLRWLHTRKEK